MTHAQCCHCNGWINLKESEYLIFNMHDGSELFAHHSESARVSCSDQYMRSHCAHIKSAMRHRRKQETSKVAMVPIDYVAERGID
jgi:hypothetical protein